MFLRTALLIFIAGVLVLTLQVLVSRTPEPVTLALTIDGVTRTAIIYPPARLAAQGAPVVFGFHSHGSNGHHAATSFRIQENWREAVVVYPEGLPTPGRTDPEGLDSGWQSRTGELADRDLKFFDALLAEVRRRYQTDPQRTYATGHSNGAGFTYLLAAARPGVLAAIAPSAGESAAGLASRPIPVLHIAGEQDVITPFATQELVMAQVRKVNGCDATPRPWGEPPAKDCQLYASNLGAPFVALIHPDGHVYPSEAPALVVRFFQEHTTPPTPPAA